VSYCARGNLNLSNLRSSPSEELDPPTPKWISDLQYAMLSRIQEYRFFEPRQLVRWGFAKDKKVAYVYAKKLERLGAIVKVGRGLYRVVHDAIAKLLQRPVRMIATGVRLSKGTRLSKPAGALLDFSGASDPPAGPSKLVLLGPYLRPRYLGLFLDNVRGFRCGRYEQLGRDLLLMPCDLELFVPNKVSYFEVCHLVGNVLVDGCVVVYTNSGDLDRFGPSCRVEYRPPEGFVRGSGLLTLRKAAVELSKCFRAIAVVLRSCLHVDELRSLFSWLSSLWSFALPPPSS